MKKSFNLVFIILIMTLALLLIFAESDANAQFDLTFFIIVKAIGISLFILAHLAYRISFTISGAEESKAVKRKLAYKINRKFR